MAISYKELGLVNTREMFKKAMAGGYAIPAYNVNNMEQLQAIIKGCVESASPVIIQVSKGARAVRQPDAARAHDQGRRGARPKSCPRASACRSRCTSTTATASRPPRAASTAASPRS